MPLPSCIVPSFDPVSPAFTPEDHQTVQTWAATMRPRGLRVELGLESDWADETYYFIARGAGTPWWSMIRMKDGLGVELADFRPGVLPGADFDSLEEALDAMEAELDEQDW